MHRTVSLAGELASNTYVGGRTALLEWHVAPAADRSRLRPGRHLYQLRGYTPRKTTDLAIAVDDVGEFDAVLLSDEQHADNLDHAGRSLAATVSARGSVCAASCGARAVRRGNTAASTPTRRADSSHRDRRLRCTCAGRCGRTWPPALDRPAAAGHGVKER